MKRKLYNVYDEELLKVGGSYSKKKALGIAKKKGARLVTSNTTKKNGYGHRFWHNDVVWRNPKFR